MASVNARFRTGKGAGPGWLVLAAAVFVSGCGPSMRSTTGYTVASDSKTAFPVEYIAAERLGHDKCMRGRGLLKSDVGHPELEEFDAPGGVVRVTTSGDNRPPYNALQLTCIPRGGTAVDAALLRGMINERQVNTGKQNALIALSGPRAMIGQKLYYEWDSIFSLPADCTTPAELVVTQANALMAKDGSPLDRVVKYRLTRNQPPPPTRDMTDAQCAASKACKLDGQCHAGCGRCVP